MQISILKQTFLGFIVSIVGSITQSGEAKMNGAKRGPASEDRSISKELIPGTVEALTPILPGEVPPEALRKEAVRIPTHQQELKRLFPEATDFKEVDFLPFDKGGTSFTGLVTRLLGVGLDREHEGLRTRRFYYLALEKNRPIGVAHGSSFQSSAAQAEVIDVWTFYTIGGTLREVQIHGLKAGLLKEIADFGFLKQFEGKSTEDFEVITGRKGRVRSRGALFKSIRYPPGQQAKAVSEKIFRSLRFNAAFMDVAFFITQHPDLADRVMEDFPEEISVVKGQPVSGPEAFVSDKAGGSPIDGSPATNTP
jgi:hypothetical protein